jgi:hypothetical protein
MIVARFSLPSDDDVLESATKLGLIFFFLSIMVSKTYQIHVGENIFALFYM